MKITIPLIKIYNPCQDGIDEFEKKYPNYNNSLVHLLELQDVSYSDKMWLATRVLDKMTLVQWSAECAEMVVDNFNKEFPDDNSVNETIQTVKDYVNGLVDESAMSAARSAAWSVAASAMSAARSAAWSVAASAESAARSAARSARSAAWSAESATWSAARSVAWSVAASAESAAWSAARSARSAAWSAESAAESAWSAEIDQENLNLSILIALTENL